MSRNLKGSTLGRPKGLRLVVSSDLKRGWFRVEARVPGVEWGVGSLLVERGQEGYMNVMQIDVSPRLQRQGVATAMYERAARIACDDFDSQLASGMLRSPPAQAFWRKQLEKGRARSTGRGFYALSCPAPKSLKGVR